MNILWPYINIYTLFYLRGPLYIRLANDKYWALCIDGRCIFTLFSPAGNFVTPYYTGVRISRQTPS